VNLKETRKNYRSKGDNVKRIIPWLCLKLSLVMIVLMFVSCASQPVPPPSEWRYEKGAVKLRLQADNQLNLYDDNPHTLSLCVYQLRDPNTFNQLAEDEDGLYKLLECERFDASVVSSKRLIVRPGQDLESDLDRAEGARYVAVVAGYYQMFKENMVRLYDVPWIIESKGFLGRTKESKPAPLVIELVLGSEQISNLGGK
jgi:type VI secretion system VasD/TssJ family lipoprotein